VGAATDKPPLDFTPLSRLAPFVAGADSRCTVPSAVKFSDTPNVILALLSFRLVARG
jgi:hypothetical protein